MLPGDVHRPGLMNCIKIIILNTKFIIFNRNLISSDENFTMFYRKLIKFNENFIMFYLKLINFNTNRYRGAARCFYYKIIIL